MNGKAKHIVLTSKDSSSYVARKVIPVRIYVVTSQIICLCEMKMCV